MQSRAARLFAIFAGYTALGLFIAAANSLTYLSTGNAANWIPSIKRSLGEWHWLGGAHALHSAARRTLPDSKRAVRNGGIHPLQRWPSQF